MDLIGEVIEADVSEFICEGFRLMEPPPLGSLVKVGSGIEIYGAVYFSETRPRDPGRRAFALGEEDVLRKKPHLTKLLVTLFRVIVLGYREGGRVYRYLPPLPAPIHGLVYLCDEGEVREFASSLEFLDILLRTELSGIGDDVVAHFLKRASLVFEDPDGFLLSAGKEISRIMGFDAKRMSSIMRRIRA